jgi:predicted amidohydrolase YtcJ
VSSFLLRHAEVDGARVDVRIEEGLIAMVGPPGDVPSADVVIDCAGGALLPGLHDHHLHLLAMAAAAGSVDVSSGLDDAVRAAHAQSLPGAALRAVHYDEVRDGPLDRWRLDALAPGRAVRVQHRSGALWVLSSAALEQVGAADPETPDGREFAGDSATGEAGIERDQLGRPTGRLFRLDDWLRQRLLDNPADRMSDRASSPDLAAVGRRLASFGVTGVTDCTPAAVTSYFDPLVEAVRSGALPLTVWITGSSALSEAEAPSPLRRGPVKLLITDHVLPSLDQVRQELSRAHRAGRAVAVHCVSRAALLLALAAWHEVGSLPGDRIEHASVTPLEALPSLRELALTVVTQPAFIAARGDGYLAEVEAADIPDLYRCASLQEAGVPVGGSTDAPFGPDDPWYAMRAAMERRAASGAPVGSDRGLAPTDALHLFLGLPERPGGPPRRVTPGAPADLCLLDVPLGMALRQPSSEHVVATFAGGKRTYTA